MSDQTADVFTPPLSTNPSEIADQQAAEMRARMPGWRPVPGAWDTNMLASGAQVSAETRAALNDRLRSEVRALLGSIFGVPQGAGAPAFSSITVVANDAAGHTLDAGRSLFIGDLELETVEDLQIVAPATTGTVHVQAVVPGADANDVIGDVELDALDWLADNGVTLDAPLAGGSDPESDTDYDRRLRDEVQILAPTPTTAERVAVYLRRNPLIGWAWAIKGYNADTDAADQARTVTAVVATLDGLEILEPVRTAALADLRAQRETNWNVFVVSPTYVDVDVDATVVVKAGYDPDTVIADVEAAITQAVSPGGHMLPRGAGTPANYQPATTIHVNGLIAEAGQADGVDYIPTLEIGDGEADHITLSSPLELPRRGTITVTVA